mmetsp:Transcript_40410/g.91223  ORF Transcript_40410/g.91223 Transcript_40410/m.91223 type:complete len:232 (-) Transcript_40410:18-713(-)
MQIPRTRLLQSFAAWPIPTSPQCTIFLPMCVRSFSEATNAASGPPTMNVRVACSAPIVPPETGASTRVAPRDEAAAATSWDTAGSHVEQSMSREPAVTPPSERIPPSPRYTFLTWGLEGSIVTTVRADAATSAGDDAAVAPAAVRVLRLASLTSKATTWRPAFNRFLAMGEPMFPRPMKPTGPSSANCCVLEARLRVRPPRSAGGTVACLPSVLQSLRACIAPHRGLALGA